jgi:hypothetical protein
MLGELVYRPSTATNLITKPMDKGLDDIDLDDSDDSMFIPKYTLTPPLLTQPVGSKKRQERHDSLSPD